MTTPIHITNLIKIENLMPHKTIKPRIHGIQRPLCKTLRAMAALFLFQAPVAYAIDGSEIINTIAGRGLGEGGSSTAALFRNPNAVATDKDGNLFIVDQDSAKIFKVSAAGIITTLAGTGTQGTNGDDGPALEAQLNYPSGIAIDNSGNIFIIDSYNYCIRKINKAGIISTVAGTGTQGFSGDGGEATRAKLDNVTGIAVNADGELFIADSNNNRIRKVSKSGIITTIAGNGSAGFSGDNGPATAAGLMLPSDVTVDSLGNLYIADKFNHRIRKVDTNGNITTVGGNGTSGSNGDGGSALSAQIQYPSSVAVDSTGNIFFADDANARIRRITPSGLINTVAGNGTWGFSGDGGLATAAQFDGSSDITVDAAFNLYIADTNNNRVRKVDSTGTISTVAGSSSHGSDDGSAIAATFGARGSLTPDFDGNLFMADSDNHRVLKITTAGRISTIAGDGTDGYSGDNGPAAAAKLGNPTGILFDRSGNLLIVDNAKSVIRKITPTGTITTVVGNGAWGYSGDEGPALKAQLNNPSGIAQDRIGNLYIADTNNNRIRKITADGIIKTIAGIGIPGNTGDGGPAKAARISYPRSIAVNSSGDVFIADETNFRIRKINAEGIITTIAGNGIEGYSGDGGFATSAKLETPTGIAVDSADNVYIADSNNSRIRKVNTAGFISTVTGTGISGDSGDGGSALAAKLTTPQSVAVDTAGNLFTFDNGANRIRKVGNASLPAVCALPWGGTLASGYSITAYAASSSVNCAAAAETRICSNGLLSGTFSFPACAEVPDITPPVPPPVYNIDADLLLKIATRKSIKNGRSYNYTFTLKNRSLVEVPNLILKAELVGGARYTKLKSFCTVFGQQLTCNAGNLAKKKQRVFTISATPIATGTVSLSATLSGSANEINPVDNQGTVTTNVKR